MKSAKVLSCNQVREVDRRAIQTLGIPGMVLMENAGRRAADLLVELGIRGPVGICCGRGNNGGDGLVVARHLDARGFAVRVLYWHDPATMRGDAALNDVIAARAGIARYVWQSQHLGTFVDMHLNDCDWIVDGLLGTGSRGAPRAPLDEVIRAINAQPGRRLALDLPSGVDGDTGAVGGPAIRADHTVTFVAAKPGLLVADAGPWVGQLHLADIGVPRSLLADFGIAGPPAPNYSDGVIEGGS